MLRFSLLRHAKAATESATQKDHDRPLMPAGEAQAAALNAWLMQKHMKFDLAICSTALRAQQTADTALKNCVTRRENHPVIYRAIVDELVTIIAGEAKGAKNIIVVGHNPTIAVMAQWLLAVGQESNAFRGGYNPCTLAVFDVAIADWSLLQGGCGRIIEMFEANQQ